MIGSLRARLLVMAALGTLAQAALAQVVTLQDAIESKAYPATIQPKELPTDFKAVEIKVGGGSSYYETMLPFLGMSMGMGGGGREQKMLLLMGLMDVSWTSGKIVRVQLSAPDATGSVAPESGDFLVTYKLDMGLLDLAAMGSEASGAPSVSLKLVLVRTNQIASMSARPKIDRNVLLSLNDAAAEVSAEVGGAQTAAKQTQTLSNVKQMCLATIMYATDYDDVLPYAQSTSAVRYVTQPYCKNWEIFKTANPNGGEIRFNMAVAGVEMPQIDKPADTVLFYESTPWPDGTRVVGYVDGHARKLQAAEWASAEATLKLKFKKKGKPLPANYGVKEDPLRSQPGSATSGST